ncbi:hypothetical protein K466DRAFT_395813 [Polyporus arcularius HHB13444]|uniref:Uncharacterized protein n=1 Tax=Polyporus arcularius HHB13444 TaxID=1314778 RepID=A0A5C3NR79_9APHY|nr:hypothetical protein K466DRAFT_395813 [Polyporus arcularius HHB13444]
MVARRGKRAGGRCVCVCSCHWTSLSLAQCVTCVRMLARPLLRSSLALLEVPLRPRLQSRSEEHEWCRCTGKHVARSVTAPLLLSTPSPSPDPSRHRPRASPALASLLRTRSRPPAHTALAVSIVPPPLKPVQRSRPWTTCLSAPSPSDSQKTASRRYVHSRRTAADAKKRLVSDLRVSLNTPDTGHARGSETRRVKLSHRICLHVASRSRLARTRHRPRTRRISDGTPAPVSALSHSGQAVTETALT